jgi:small subunit ribosomal protein S16
VSRQSGRQRAAAWRANVISRCAALQLQRRGSSRWAAPNGKVWRSARFSLKDSSIMVVIRLARGGAKKRPFYNIVVSDSRERRDGRFIERVGFYNPMAAGGEQPLRVAVDRVSYWSSVGAKLSPTVARLVDQAKTAA